MPKCTECGFSETEKTSNRDPITLRPCLPRTVTVKCLYDPKNQKRFSDPFFDRECNNFIQKIPGWSVNDYHSWKDRNIANNRNFKITISLTIIAVLISAFSIYLSAIPYLNTDPEVDLSFQFFKDEMVGPLDYTFRASFTLYNQGTKICFVNQAGVYELLNDGTRNQISQISDAREIKINPEETKTFTYEVFNVSEESATKEYQIIVFYEPDKYVISPVIVVDWFDNSF